MTQIVFSPPARDFLPPADPDAFFLLMDREGRNLRQARDYWAAMLPEFGRRELWKKLPGCSSLAEYARRIGGLGERSVGEVLRLERQLRPWRPLFELFRRGASQSRLREVAPHVASLTQARRYARWISGGVSIRKIRARLEREGLRVPRGPRRVPAPVPVPTPDGPSNPGLRAPQENGTAAPASPRELGGPVAAPLGSEGTAHTLAEPPPAFADDPERVPVGGFLWTRAEAQMLAALHRAEADLAGRGFRTGELLARLVEARLDYLTRQQAAGALTPEDSLDHPDRDQAKPLAPSRPAPPRPADAREVAAGAEPTPPAPEPRRSLPKLGRHLAYVMVVHRNESTGRTTWRTRYGLVDVSEEDLAGRTRIGPELDHDEVHQAACAAARAARARGQATVPAACQRELLLDSSGLCEAEGCAAFADESHHRTRQAWEIDHNTEEMDFLCAPHHDADHDPDRGDPEGPDDEPDRARRRIMEARTRERS